MTRILVTSDWHLDAYTAGVSRFDELEAAVEASVGEATSREVSAYVFCGDLCDPDSGSISFRCAELAFATATALERANIRSYWLVGNHDVIENGSGLSTLHALRALGLNRPCLTTVLARPGLESIRTAELLFLPYAASSDRYDPRDVARTTVEELGKKEEPPHLVVFGHLTIPGIVPGEETTEMGRGRDMVFPYEELCAYGGPITLVNGHYHSRQAFTPKGGQHPIHIPGSLAQLTFGETHSPAFTLIDLE